MKIKATEDTRKALQDQIDRSRGSHLFVKKDETLAIPELCKRIGLISGYADVNARIQLRMLKVPPDEPIVVCSDASVIFGLDGVAGTGFIAYTERSHNLVGYGYAMLTHAIGKKFSSQGAETLGMAISAYAMRGFTGTITCDNDSSVNIFNRACRHTHMEEIARWGKGHANSLGNLFADQAAKKALFNIRDLSASLGRPALIDGGRYMMTPRSWGERIVVDSSRNRRVSVSANSRFISDGNGLPDNLRTALVQVPCLENPCRHIFMIVGMRGRSVISVESGALSSDSECQGWSDHVPLMFMRHIQHRYAKPGSNIHHISVSPYIRRYHDAGLRDMDREIDQGCFDLSVNGYKKSKNPQVRLTGLMEAMRDLGTGFSIEPTLRGSSIEQWDNHVRSGFSPMDGMEEFLMKNPIRSRWKRFQDEGQRHVRKEVKPLLDPSIAPQPDIPHDHPEIIMAMKAMQP